MINFYLIKGESERGVDAFEYCIALSVIKANKAENLDHFKLVCCDFCFIF